MIPNPKYYPTCGPKLTGQAPVDPDEELAKALYLEFMRAVYGPSFRTKSFKPEQNSVWLKVARKAREMLKVNG